MENVIVGIWHGAPKWVWPLLVGLVTLGLIALKQRRSSIFPFFLYPLFGLTSIGSITNLQHSPINWIIFTASYTIGAGLAYLWQNSLVIEKSNRKVRLKGEPFTLIILMMIFFSNFVGGVFSAVAPHLLTAPVYTCIFATVVGMCSGSFTGRAARVITLPSSAAV